MHLKRYEELGSSIDALERRNEYLEHLLEERRQVRYEHVLAGIVGKDPQNYYQSFIIDKGTKDGLAKRMPVVAYENGKLGVVGRISVATPTASLVVTIRSQQSYIGVLLDSSRYYGLVRGNGRAANCLVEYVDIDAPARNGDWVITSGQSDIYPSGLSIGILTNISRESGQFFLRAELQPMINFARLENVYVIKKLPSADIEELEREQEKQ
jgi:rod shape-determining protein MreC